MKESMWLHFFGFFQRGDLFCMYQASRIIAKFACWSFQLMDENDLVFYLNWLKDQIKITVSYIEYFLQFFVVIYVLFILYIYVIFYTCLNFDFIM